MFVYEEWIKTLKVGDKVRVKTKEEFKRDYPNRITTDRRTGDIEVDIPSCFAEPMNELCNREFIIDYKGSLHKSREFTFYNIGLQNTHWSWNTLMIMPCNTPKGNKFIPKDKR